MYGNDLVHVHELNYYKMKTYKLNTPYSQYTVILSGGSYANGRQAIRIVDAEDGSPVMTATVNLPEVPLEQDEVIIKNYSENEGCLPFLITNGVVSSVERWVGHGMAVVKLLIDIDDI
jgi:hypothetical protein